MLENEKFEKERIERCRIDEENRKELIKREQFRTHMSNIEAERRERLAREDFLNSPKYDEKGGPCNPNSMCYKAYGNSFAHPMKSR